MSIELNHVHSDGSIVAPVIASALEAFQDVFVPANDIHFKRHRGNVCSPAIVVGNLGATRSRSVAVRTAENNPTETFAGDLTGIEMR